MAHQWIRANLASAIFPFETDLAGRTVIIAGLDENYNYLDQLGEPIKDRGIPQVYYMHNVLPTPQGYQSIGYTKNISGLAGHTDFDTIIPLDYVSPQVTRVLLAPAAGKNYVYDAAVGVWTSVSPLAAGTVPDNVLVTYAYVNGVTYFYYSGYGCFYYDTVGKVMVAQALTGLTAVNIVGIVGQSGYMIAYDNAGNISWSSATNPVDFTPSLVTGAGGGSLQYADGRINFAVPIANGFMVYCERNTVSAQYSGNINFPWTFKEVIGSGGCFSIEDCSFMENAGSHYAWTTAGLQQLTPNAASNVFPEITNFFGGLTFEDFDELTLTFTQSFLATPLYLKISFAANRYVVFSYGVNLGTYTHALVYDTTLSRWGKFKVTHRKVFEWTAPNLYGAVTYGQFATAQPKITYGMLSQTTYAQLLTSLAETETPEKNLGFLQMDGTILTINQDLSEVTADGVLLLGKFQLQRNKWLQIQKVDANNIEIGNNFAAYIIATLDGQNFQPPILISQPPNLILAGPKLWRMGADVLGQNITLLFTGGFNMVSVQMDWTLGGDI